MDNSINERVERIKGNRDEINRFIEEYKPFIASCVEKFTGKYVMYGESDELSIALIAFAESIEAFDSSKGNFLTFAQNVIRKRLIDYYRKEKKYKEITMPSIYYEETNDEEIDISEKEAADRYSIDENNEYRRLEIEELKKELAAWGITFKDLVRVSPKHKSTKKVCKKIIKFIISKPELVNRIKVKKYLPVSEIQNNLKISQRKIENLRKYIITVIIVITGDYEYIKEYLKDYIIVDDDDDDDD